MSYYTLRIHQVKSDQGAEISSLAFDHGCLGIEQPLEFEQKRGDYLPDVLESERSSLTLYFSKSPSEKLFKELDALRVDYQLAQEQDKDWLAEWKKGFHAFALVEDTWVVPSWESPPPEAAKVLSIDPGMAFGTGTHETTQLVAHLLAEWTTDNKPQSFFDVGTGTGILALYMAKSGVADIWATEIDETARQVAAENARRNFCNIHVLDHQIEQVERTFQAVAANIIDGILLHLKPDLIRTCESELFLSGVLVERSQEFERQFFSEIPFRLVAKKQKNEWMSYHLRRHR